MSEAFQKAMKEGKIQDTSLKPKKKNDYEKALMPGNELIKKHKDSCIQSGHTEKTIEELGVKSSLNYNSIIFPIWDINKKKIRGYRARYNDEVIKANKYPSREEETPKYRPSEGLGNVFFFPHIGKINWSEIAQNPKVPIFITEGEKKAAKLTQEGYPAIGLFGVNNWARTETREINGKEVEVSIPIDDFELIKWKERIIYIVYDSDKYKNIHVLIAEARLWAHFADLNADARVINLPYDSEAKGIDDFFVKHGDGNNE